MSKILVDQIRSNSASADAITLDGSGKCAINATTINNLTFPTSDGSADQIIKTNGSGTLSFGATAGTLVSAHQDGSTAESTTSTTNTWTDSDISITLTPAAAANKFFCVWDTHCRIEVSSADVQGFGKVRLIRDSTPISETHMGTGSTTSSNGGNIIGMGGSAWDHPNTTSSITYKLQFWLNDQQSGNYMAMNWSAWGYTANGSKLTILEFKQ